MNWEKQPGNHGQMTDNRYLTEIRVFYEMRYNCHVWCAIYSLIKSVHFGSPDL